MRLVSPYQVFVVLIISKINQSFSIAAFYNTTKNQHYFVNDEQKFTWFDSFRQCLIRNMTLATIETDIKSHEINTMIKKNFGKNVILWVGGLMNHFSLESRQYVWITTGETFNYVYWHGNNPDFYKNNEYCIQIGWGANMEWNDNNCANKFGFICQEKYNRNDHQSVMEKKLKELQQRLFMEIKDRQNLQQELNIQTKAQQDLKDQLQQIKYNDLKNEELLKYLQINRKEKDNLQQQQESQTSKNIPQKQKELQREDEDKKYRNIIFQFYQNPHFMSKENLA